MKKGLKQRIASAAFCFVAVSAMEAPAAAGFHPSHGFSQACRLLFQKKGQEVTKRFLVSRFGCEM
ncbi:MAG: hypothetical protein ACLPPF_21990 [Rhodomicrobium sp.]